MHIRLIADGPQSTKGIMMAKSETIFRTIACALAISIATSAPAHARGLLKKIMITGVVAAGAGAIAKSVNAKQTANVSFSMDGKVIHVDDGDTVKLLLVDNQTKNIRLTDIDAPESEHGQNRPSQRFSRASRDSLASMVHGKFVRADCYDTDIYKRPVCRLYVGDVDVNLEQVRRGMAWANLSNRNFVRNDIVFSIHDEAKAGGVGLWADAKPVEPWNWRKICWIANQCNGSGI